MPHFIEDTCVGCTLCAKNCPTDAIYGESKKLFIIQPELCIDCSICGNVCPVTCITDQLGNYVPKLKLKDKPKAYIIESGCTGCEACLEVCPVDAIITTEPNAKDDAFGIFAVCEVIPDKCIGCELCYKICPWETIEMEDEEKSTFAYQAGGYVSRLPTS